MSYEKSDERKSTGELFHTGGSLTKKLAIAFPIVRETCSWCGLVDMRLERPVQCDVGWKNAAKYDGTRSWVHYTPTELSCKWSFVCLASSQVHAELASSTRTSCTCNDASRGILNHLQFVQKLATNTNQGAVAVVETTSNKRVYQCRHGLDRQWLLSCGSWKKQDRLSAAIWLAWVSWLSSRTPRSLTTSENCTVAFARVNHRTTAFLNCWHVPRQMTWALSSLNFSRLLAVQSRMHTIHLVSRPVASMWCEAVVLTWTCVSSAYEWAVNPHSAITSKSSAMYSRNKVGPRQTLRNTKQQH